MFQGEKRYRTSNCERIRVDLKDCDPKGIQDLGSKPVVALGKHLCGAGFDFGLRCCFRLFDSKSLQAIVVAQCCHHRCMWKAYPSKSTSFLSLSFFLQDLLFLSALTNHFPSSSDKLFLKKIGITKRKFPLLIAVCSWALCAMPKTTNSTSTTPGGKGAQEEEEEHERITTTGHSHPQHILRLSSDEKEVLGFQCKRLLDMGRVLHLREKGFKSKLVYFVSQDISPENVLLVAFLPQIPLTEVTDQQLSETSETSTKVT
jgi:tRNA:m4X modification enzyme